MTRREARENAFKIIFEVPFYGHDRINERLEYFWSSVSDEVTVDDKKYINDVVTFCFENIISVDEKISDKLEN